jgi:hypothetical protein
LSNDNAPASTIEIDNTAAKMGRSMKKREHPLTSVDRLGFLVLLALGDYFVHLFFG